MPFVAVGEIGRVNQAESGRREQLALLALARGGFHQLGGIPFTEIDANSFGLEPPFQEINLGGFAGAIEPLDGNQTPRKIQFGKSFHEQAENLNLRRRNTMFLIGESSRAILGALQPFSIRVLVPQLMNLETARYATLQISTYEGSEDAMG
jgi:hypothetical protein